MADMRNTIGKTLEETMDEDWKGYWPVIDHEGKILEIIEADNVPQDAIMVDWENGKPIRVDGDHGFDAVLDPWYSQFVS